MKESRLGFLVDGLFVYLSLLLGLCTAVLVFCMCVFVFEGRAEGPRLGFLADVVDVVRGWQWQGRESGRHGDR